MIGSVGSTTSNAETISLVNASRVEPFLRVAEPLVFTFATVDCGMNEKWIRLPAKWLGLFVAFLQQGRKAGGVCRGVRNRSVFLLTFAMVRIKAGAGVRGL